MRKHHSDNLVRRLLLAFLTSACQYTLFGSIFIIYMVVIPWPPIEWMLIVPYLLIPMFSAFGCCFLMHRSYFRFDSRNMASKVSAYRLAARLLSTFCFLLIGYIVSTKHVMQISVSDWVNMFGEYASVLSSLLTNFFFYLIVAIFPIVFALVEYLFVTRKQGSLP